MQVALCQRASTVGEIKPNLAQAIEDLDEHGPENDLVLFPELFLAGYNAQDDHHELALAEGDPALEELSAKAVEHETTVIVGGPRRGEVRGLTHNSAFVFTPDGETDAYDKVHLPTFNVFQEGLFFAPGDRGLITELPDGTTLGVAICYDLFFPEITKDLALRGADVIATISASPVTSQPYFEAVLPARSLETTSFVLYCNLTGVQDHLTFWGSSRAYSPLGEQLVEAPQEEEAVVTCELDLDEVELARKKRPCLRDTRMFPWGQAEGEAPWPTSREALESAEDA